MGLPLYVARSPSVESDTQTRRREKISGSSRSIRRRARIDDLARDSERERSRRRQRAVFIANYVNERSSDEDQSPRRAAPQISNVRPWGFPELGSRRRRSWERFDAERQRRIEDRVREQARDQAAYEQELIANLHRDPLEPASADNEGETGSGGELRRRVGANMLDGVRRAREARRARNTERPHSSVATGPPGPRQVTFGFDPWELYLMQNGRIAEAEAMMGGLQNRNRGLFQSPGPDEDDDDNNEAWDTLLTTLTPDPQPPSAGSSFASATATSQNSTRSASSNRVPAMTHDCGGVCEICARARASSASAYPRLVLRPDFGRDSSRAPDAGISASGDASRPSAFTFYDRRRHWRQMRDFARDIRSDSVERYTERIIDELNRIERRGGVIPEGTPLNWRPPLVPEDDRPDGFENEEDGYGEEVL